MGDKPWPGGGGRGERSSLMNPMPPYSLPLPGVGPSGRGREGGDHWCPT